MSNVTPLAPPPATGPREPRPGKPDSDGGAPPGGWPIACAGPASRTTERVVPASPGYVAAWAMPSVTPSVDGSKPRTRVTAKPGWPVPALAGGCPGASQRVNHAAVSELA